MDGGWRQHRIAGAIGAALLLVGALISVNVARQPAAELGYSEGHWDTTNGCAGGYENTETLHCNGYVDYQLP